MKTLFRALYAVVFASLAALRPDNAQVPLRASEQNTLAAVKAVSAASEVEPSDPGAEPVRLVPAVPEMRQIVVADMPAPGVFQFALEASPETMARAFLVYELTGVRHWTATVRSINGLPAPGAFGAEVSAASATQIEEINPRWLHEGLNKVAFFPTRGKETPPARVSNLADMSAVAATASAVPYTVGNLRLVYVEGNAPASPRLQLSHPLDEEKDAEPTILRGFVDPPGLPEGPAELFVNEVYLPHGIDPIDGSFAVFVPRMSSHDLEARIEVVYPNGARVRRSVHFANRTGDDDGSDNSEDYDDFDADPATAGELGVDDARLDIRPGALGAKTKLSMRRLRREDLPPMDGGMTNVTPRAGGFRLGPHGLHFRKPVELRLPYDATLIPNGMTVDDIRTFFFDEQAGRWFPIPRVDASQANAKSHANAIVSTTDHFTDFVNATLALPDESAGENFTPNSLQELAKPDPASEIVQIDPPEGDADGAAALNFPIVLPPGRAGMEPDLAVRYSSGGNNGWLGVGWDLPVSSIEISTLFGVPRYDGNESFLIDGEPLAATTTPGVFVRRIEGTFEHIERKGNGAASSWWEVTDKNGVVAIYGKNPAARLRDPVSGNTFRWYLEQKRDLHGNTIDYAYVTDHGEDGEPWTEVYPARIDYTGGPNADPYYHVVFTLDGGTRGDRLSSGIEGFKTYRRHRLARVDVLAGTTIVRSYVFTYREGDFRKSLLSSIAVTGEGGATEFYRHTFDYVSMPVAATKDGYAAFSEQEEWNGIGGSSDFTDSFRAGGGAHGFVGLGPPFSCQPHIGISLGGSGTDSTERVSFLDVNGDGLPDRLHEGGHVDINGYVPATDPNGTQAGSFQGREFGQTDALGHTSEWSLDLGIGAHSEAGIPASIGVSWVWSHANDDHLIADVNGDLRPDLVSTDGGFGVRVNDGSSFIDASGHGWTGFESRGLSLSSPGEETEVMTNFRLSNALRQLVLPYAGRVTISGAIEKKTAAGDGADAQIFHNGHLIWSRNFASTDIAPCTPGTDNSCVGTLTIDAAAGDSLYFLAGSVRDTDGDALRWSPIVSYDGRDANAREPYGARTFVFDASEDFALAGYYGASWNANATGTVAITGAFTKQKTSDDVVLTIVRKHRNDAEQRDEESTVFSRLFTADEVTTLVTFPTIAVESRDLLFLRISSATPIDPKRVQWTPTVTYQGATDPGSLPDDMLTRRAQVNVVLPRLLPTDTPTQSWTPPTTTRRTFNVFCQATDASLFYVQGVNRLVTATHLPPAILGVRQPFTVVVDTTAGAPLYFSLIGPPIVIPGLFGAEDTILPPGACEVDSNGAIPVNVRWWAPDNASNVLSGGHHGWYYGEWNGNIAFTPSRLVAPKDKNDTPDFVTAAPRWEGTKDVASPLWIAGGFDLYLNAEGVKSSRKGINAAGVLDQAAGTTSGGGLSVLRKTSSRTEGVEAGAGPVSLSLSRGESETQLELLDVNGDRYPDQVSSSGVRFSNGKNGFGSLETISGLGGSVRQSRDFNASTTIGIGINFTKKSGNGKPKAVLNTMPSVGQTVSVSQTTYDLIDVNGDGLPDRVSMSPGSDNVSVQLNLGYRFGAAETWPLPKYSPSSHCTDVVDYASSQLSGLSNLDTLNGIAVTRSSALQGGVAVGPFGGGVSMTLARTLVELTDINGDGLPDRVAKDEGNGYFRVQLNLGDRWDNEQRWYVPDWETSLGDGYKVPGFDLIRCLDAVTLSGHMEVNGSAGAPICLTLVPLIPVVGLQIEISGQGFGSVASGMQLFLDDLDGDGLSDHILKKRGDAKVYVKRNQAGRVNLLSAVHRPLGSTIEIAYDRRGNHAGMPFNQWVLAKVTVKDGRGSTPMVTKYNYGNDGFYDRSERESYGYAHLTVTLPDNSTIERVYSNRTLYSRHLLTAETLRDQAGNILKAEAAEYDEETVAGSAVSRFPALVAENTSFFEAGSSAGPVQTRQTFTYDSAGNMTDSVDENDPGIADDVVTHLEYDIDPYTPLTRPRSIVVRDGNGTLLRKRLGKYTDGELVELEQTLIGGRDPETGASYSGTKNAVWKFTRDAYGNIVNSTDPSGHALTISYDGTTHTHPLEVHDDSFGYVTRYAYDLKYGTPTSTTDENGNTISRKLDRFGRLIRVIGPYDSDDAPALSFEYGAGNPISWAVAHHKDSTRSDTIDSAVFIDSLERVIETKDEAELDSGSGITGKTGMRVSGRVEFDTKGRLISQGQPVFDERPATQSANQFVDVAMKNPTTFTYDALDRTRKVAFPQGITKIDYLIAPFDGAPRLITDRTDPAQRKTRFYNDVKGNVIAVEQSKTFSGVNKTLITRYGYDALDQLTEVTDAKKNVTRLQYDTLGRNILLDNPDLGRTEMRYDTAGNIGAKINANLAARGQQIRYFYTFGRLDRIDYPQSPDVVYLYGGPGAPFHRANRISAVTDASGVEERSYGKLGETLQSVKTTVALNGNTPRGPYVTKFEFDDFERLMAVVYPDGEKLTYGYDSGGQVRSATGLLNGVRFDYLRFAGYDEFGERTRIVYGNGVETRYSYAPASRFLSQLRTIAAGRDLQNDNYTYDASGTVQSIQNNVPVPAPSLYGGPVTQTFQYDELAQLTGAQGTYRTGPNKTSTYALTLAYDELGNTVAKNQLHQSGTGDKLNVEKKTSYNWAYTYDAPQPHAATRIGERTFHYDADGNQLGWETDANGTRRTLVWDEENRLSSVADNGDTTRFVYDADGTRTNKAGAHGETTYVNRWFTLRNGAIASKHVFADDIRLATKVSPNPNPPSEKVYFFQPDHLGSTAFVTDELAAVYQHLEYFPSGEVWVDERSETQRTPYLFSGKELDEETGLSYFGFRYYDARQGQWISADPILDGMLNTDKLARPDQSSSSFHLPGHPYAYVANNPENLIDLLGLKGKKRQREEEPEPEATAPQTTPQGLMTETSLATFQTTHGGSSQGTLAMIETTDGNHYMVEQQTNNRIKAAAEAIGIEYLPQGRLSGFHAEMRFIKDGTARGLRFRNAKIWVSKPICASCTSVLRTKGLDIQTSTSTTSYRNWISPTTRQRSVTSGARKYVGRRTEVERLKEWNAR